MSRSYSAAQGKSPGPKGSLADRPPGSAALAFLAAAVVAVAWFAWLPGSARADTAGPHAAVTSSDVARSNSPAVKRRVLLPLILNAASTTVTGATYATVPVEPPPTDRPAASHADLNLALRGYGATSEPLQFVTDGGDIDFLAPQLPGIFSDGRTPKFTSAYRVNDWSWSCGSDGCRGPAITSPPVTVLGLATKTGELLSAPSRGPEIYPRGFVALVLYADEHRITLKYTRDDNVIGGYTVHFEKLNVDSNLLALYREADAAGRTELPAVMNDQPVGVAAGAQVLVAIRDCGAFMDPRSRKDWWQGR
jgi:hypothetical protein